MSFIETKYTPIALSDYVCDGNVSSILKPYLDHQSKRPLLLYGEPGTGKTQLAKLLPKAVCEDFYEGDTIWIDAGLDRGVGKIREIENRIALYASNSMNFHCVCLDEVDQLSPDAMLALKNVLTRYMDMTSPHVLFVMTTNHIARIDAAVKDRCEAVHIDAPTIDRLVPMGLEILQNEGKKADETLFRKVLQAKSFNNRLSYREFYRRVERLAA